MSPPKTPTEIVFARCKNNMDVTISGLLKTAEASSLGIELLKDLQRWCQHTEGRIEATIVMLEQTP